MTSYFFLEIIRYFLFVTISRILHKRNKLYQVTHRNIHMHTYTLPTRLPCKWRVLHFSCGDYSSTDICRLRWADLSTFCSQTVKFHEKMQMMKSQYFCIFGSFLNFLWCFIFVECLPNPAAMPELSNCQPTKSRKC